MRGRLASVLAVLPALLLLALAGAASGCGYTLGAGRPVGDATSVALPVFDNRTFRSGVEADLARMLAAEVHARTPLRIVDTGADLVVEGTILAIEEGVLSQRENQRIRESSVLITVEVKVRDGRTGEPVVKSFKRTERESFVPQIGESLRTARSEALRRLAAEIVDELLQ